MRRGLVIVNTGDGKGKTTAALGLLMRAWGRGMKVVMLQFFKHRNARWGEIRAARKMGVEIIPLGAGFSCPDSEEDKALVREGWELCREKILAPPDESDIVILDELTHALKYGWLSLQEVIDVLSQRPPTRHVVITGRNAPPALIDFADLVTEMSCIKHPYSEGIKAQPGIEF